MVAQRLGMGLEQLVAAGQVLDGGGLRDLAGTLVIRIRHLGIDRNRFAAGQMHHHIGALDVAVRIGDHHLRIEIHMLQQAGRFHDIAQLRLAPRATHLVVSQRGRQCAGLLVQPGLLLPQAAQLLAQRAQLLLAPLLDLGDLLLQGIQILLHRGQRRQHLALFVQGLRLFGPSALGLRRGTVLLMLHTDLLGLLRLGQLRLDERQLLVQTIGLRTVLRRLRGQRSDLTSSRFQLPFHLVQLA